MEQVKIGIIGGSGLYQMPELTDIKEVEVETPFGKPSDAFYNRNFGRRARRVFAASRARA
jgi:purine nucleoside phosphorylase